MSCLTSGQIISIVTAVVGLIAGAIFQIILTEPIHYFIATKFSFLVPKSKRKLNGIWKTKYKYKTDSTYKIEQHLFKIGQFGNYIFGKNLTAKEHWYTISGKLENDIYLTGKWENNEEIIYTMELFNFLFNPLVMKWEVCG